MATLDINAPLGPTHLDLLNQLRDEPYAWPGGYPMYAILSDGEALCGKCAKDEYERLSQVERDCPDDDQWRINALSINWEDTELTCAHCSDLVESAYGGD